MRLITFALILCLLLSGCSGSSSSSGNSNATPEDAKKFIDEVNETSYKLALESSQATWVADTYITDDTSALNARASQRLIDKLAGYAKEAVRFDKVDVSPDI